VPDLLADAAWDCASTPAGVVDSPAGLPPDLEWLPARVPGTAAAALLAAGHWAPGDTLDFDETDWWFRCRLPQGLPDGPLELRLGGIATLADVWVDGVLVLTSRNMFTAHCLVLAAARAGAELVIRCSSLAGALEARAPRPRWKTKLVGAQSMRWFRTALVGRMPGWGELAGAVGPWRPVHLVPAARELTSVRLAATCAGDGGAVHVRGRLARSGVPTTVELVVGSASAPLTVRADGDGAIVEGSVTLDQVERWWPAGSGPQPLYDVVLVVDGDTLPVGRVGFRELTVDRTGGAFTLSVNGVVLFCRGACWVPVDPVGLAPAPAAQRAALEQAVAGGMNMVRVPGTMTYEDDAFWDLCDELGVLVWQDVMCADMDYPNAPEFVALVTAELEQLFGRLQGRPSLAVVSGGSETEQQATMLGLPPDRRTSPLATDAVPRLLEDWLPGTPYVVSTPTGGPLAIRSDTGVAHYFGVGGYRRPLSDVRTAGVRFAAECLALATPPERGSVDAMFGGAAALGTPAWKAAVPHDNGSPWDFEDVRDHYVRELFHLDPAQLARTEPDRALDLGRAVVAELVTRVFSEWRRAASPCAGGLVLALRDLRAGAGVGLIDSLGVPKAPFYALARVNRPIALLAVDEGLNGLRLHACNDAALPLVATLRVRLYGPGGALTEQAERRVEVAARSIAEFDVEDLIGGFRDVTWAYRFGAAGTDLVAAELVDDTGVVVAAVTHFVLGPERARADIGLGVAVEHAAGGWLLRVSTALAAQYVSVQCPGFLPSDSWLHLPPGGSAGIALTPVPGAVADPTAVPRGHVRALNAALPVAFGSPN
jgi:beta-mannosidase